MKKALLYTTILASTVLFNSGCATYVAKKQWDKAQEQKAVRIEADGNQVLVGVDLLSMDYLKDNWKWAIPAAVVDGLIIYQSYQWIDDISNGSSGDSSGNQRNNSVNISGNNESSISISISGDSSTTSDTRNDNSNNNFN